MNKWNWLATFKADGHKTVIWVNNYHLRAKTLNVSFFFSSKKWIQQSAGRSLGRDWLWGAVCLLTLCERRWMSYVRRVDNTQKKYVVKIFHCLGGVGFFLCGSRLRVYVKTKNSWLFEKMWLWSIRFGFSSFCLLLVVSTSNTHTHKIGVYVIRCMGATHTHTNQQHAKEKHNPNAGFLDWCL